METTDKTPTRLDQLKNMRLAIEDCKNRHPELEWGDMLERANDMVIEEQRRLGYMAVYPIKDGSAQESIFEGLPEACQVYVDIMLEGHPEMKENIIVLNI